MLSEKNQDVWPPSDAAAFIRSEAFGQLVLDVAAALARRYRRMDFTNAAARVFVWFDRKVAEDPQFLSAKRFPRPSALRAYLRQALWNDARRTERDEHRQRALAHVSFDESPDEWGVSPEDAVMLQELLDRLPSLHRRIVRALVFGEQTVAKLSVALGVSKRRVAALFREAIDRLRTGWEEEQRR